MSQSKTENKPQLPAINVHIKEGKVSSNLDVYKEKVTEHIKAINTNLVDQEQFDEAKAQVAWLKEKRIKLIIAKQQFLAESGDVSAVIDAFNELEVLMTETQSNLNKQIVSDMARRKAEVLAAASEAITEAFTESLKITKISNASLTVNTKIDLAVGKGKQLKGYTTDINAARDSIIADIKSQQNQIAANDAVFKALVNGTEFLFGDLSTLLLLPSGEFVLTMNGRMDNHKAKVKEEAAAAVEREVKRIAAKKAKDEEAATQLNSTITDKPSQDIKIESPTLQQAFSEEPQQAAARVVESTLIQPETRIFTRPPSAGPVLKSQQTSEQQALEGWIANQFLIAINSCPNSSVKSHLIDCRQKAIQLTKAA